MDRSLGEAYSSPTQKIRVMSESWARHNVYCASCGSPIERQRNNTPVLDFRCLECREEYELKSKKIAFARKIVDGAYKTMLKRLMVRLHPNFFFLSYDPYSYEISNFFLVPAHFLHPSIIEKRPPLKETAERAGWIGCNILLDQVPQIGRIHYIRQRQPVPRQTVLAAWHRSVFLKRFENNEAKSWTLDVLRCIERMGLKEFTLKDIYCYESELKLKYPKNNFIKDQIRKQLQILRDQNYLEFKGTGKYRVI